eukprot:2134385-Rhodomonas_salina.2
MAVAVVVENVHIRKQPVQDPPPDSNGVQHGLVGPVSDLHRGGHTVLVVALVEDESAARPQRRVQVGEEREGVLHVLQHVDAHHLDAAPTVSVYQRAPSAQTQPPGLGSPYQSFAPTAAPPGTRVHGAGRRKFRRPTASALSSRSRRTSARGSRKSRRRDQTL